jgi:hypothetical protein
MCGPQLPSQQQLKFDWCRLLLALAKHSMKPVETEIMLFGKVRPTPEPSEHING